MTQVEELKTILDHREDLQKYLFIRGFLVSNKEPDITEGFPFYRNWTKVKDYGACHFYIHSLTGAHFFQKENRLFFLLGHAYNPFTLETEEETILERIAEGYGTPQYIDRINELTGVFAYGVTDGAKVEFMVDPAGMQSFCYGRNGDAFYLCSYPQLLGDICRLSMDPFVKELLDYKWYYRVMGPYLPGDLEPFSSVKRVVANHYYEYEKERVSHHRIFPESPIRTYRTGEEYDKAVREGAEIMRNTMKCIAKKWAHPAISLTGGIDSNTTFAAANGFYGEFEAFSYVSSEKEKADSEAARAIAVRFQVPFTKYDIPDSEEELKDYGEIVRIIDHNNGYIAKGRPNEYRKRVYLMRHLKTDVEVKSWVSELGRAQWYKHFHRKTMPALSPKLFRNLYKIFLGNRKLAHKVDRVFAEFIHDFEIDTVGGEFLPADIHKWEVSYSSWGGLNLSEMKIYGELTIPYNNRKLLYTLLCFPLEDRIKDTHHLAMKKMLNPELYEMNILIDNDTSLKVNGLNAIFTMNSILPF